MGIVAAITNPSVVNRTIETSDRTKITKAMAVYEQFVTMFLLDNGIQTEAQAAEIYENANDCEFITKYFKVKTLRDDISGCAFETNDGLLWNFESLPIDVEAGPNASPNKYALLTKVQFADGHKIKIQGHEVELPEGKKAEYFRFYFHYAPENGGLYVNDPEHVPWHHYQGTNWCSSHPFNHGCWSGAMEYDSIALLAWQYLKMAEYKVYNYNF